MVVCLVVSMVAFNSDDPSFNLANVQLFALKLYEMNKKRPTLAHFEICLQNFIRFVSL